MALIWLCHPARWHQQTYWPASGSKDVSETPVLYEVTLLIVGDIITRLHLAAIQEQLHAAFDGKNKLFWYITLTPWFSHFIIFCKILEAMTELITLFCTFRVHVCSFPYLRNVSGSICLNQVLVSSSSFYWWYICIECLDPVNHSSFMLDRHWKEGVWILNTTLSNLSLAMWNINFMFAANQHSSMPVGKLRSC